MYSVERERCRCVARTKEKCVGCPFVEFCKSEEAKNEVTKEVDKSIFAGQNKSGLVLPMWGRNGSDVDNSSFDWLLCTTPPL